MYAEGVGGMLLIYYTLTSPVWAALSRYTHVRVRARARVCVCVLTTFQ